MFLDGESAAILGESYEGGGPRRLALRLAEEAEGDTAPFLSDLFARAFREVRPTPAERMAVVQAVRGLVTWRRRLAFVFGEGEARSLWLAGLLREPQGAVALGEAEARLQAEPSRTTRLGLTHSLPDWLVDVIVGDVGDGAAEAACARLNETAPLTLRVATTREPRERVMASLRAEGLTVDPSPHAQAGLVVSGVASVFATEAFKSGLVEVQDEASQLVAELVAPPPGGCVVDACAGAGGKTLALGDALGGKGRVVALDPSSDKLEELRRRVRRAGLSNVRSLQASLGDGPAVEGTVIVRGTGDLSAVLEARGAHRVLVDAPCSGLGALRRNPEARWRMKEADLGRLTDLQRTILEAAALLVAPGGRLIYATCSFLRREGEEVVARFLASHPAFKVMTVRDVFGRARSQAFTDETGTYLRTWRGEEATVTAGGAAVDGFFAAVLRKP